MAINQVVGGIPVSNILLIGTYELTAILFLTGLYQRVGMERDLELEFDSYYFLKWSFGLSLAAHIGFITLVAFLFRAQQAQSLAVTGLVAMPAWMVMAAWLQWSFSRRYHKISNVIRRLELLPEFQRSGLLQRLPPRVFKCLPGDYRL